MQLPSPDLQIGRARTVTLIPSVPFAQPRAHLYDGEGTLLLTPTATASAVSTTVAESAQNSQQRLKLSSLTGVAPRLWIVVEDPTFGRARAQVSGLEGDQVRLIEPLPATPAAGSTVKGLDIAVSLPALSEPAIGHVLEVEDLANPHVETTRTDINVVRYPFLGPCLPEHVRDLVAKQYGGESRMLADAALQERIAETVNACIRARLLGYDEYASRFWSPAVLQPVRLPMLRLVLAEGYGYREAGVDPTTYLTSLRNEVKERFKSDVLRGRQLRDVDGDEKITKAEAEGAGQNTARWER